MRQFCECPTCGALRIDDVPEPIAHIQDYVVSGIPVHRIACKSCVSEFCAEHDIDPDAEVCDERA